jgi:transposase
VSADSRRGAKRHLSVTKARPLLASVRPWDAVGKARKELALDYAAELQRLGGREEELKKNIADVLAEHPTTLLEINGVGPINAAKIHAETGDVRRFAGRHHFASYTGTPPIGAVEPASRSPACACFSSLSRGPVAGPRCVSGQSRSAW